MLDCIVKILTSGHIEFVVIRPYGIPSTFNAASNTREPMEITATTAKVPAALRQVRLPRLN
jgi:hypothetical protein